MNSSEKPAASVFRLVVPPIRKHKLQVVFKLW